MRIFTLTMLTPFSFLPLRRAPLSARSREGKGGFCRLNTAVASADTDPGPPLRLSILFVWLAPSTLTAVGCSKPLCLNCVNGPTTAGAAGAGQLRREGGFLVFFSDASKG